VQGNFTTQFAVIEEIILEKGGKIKIVCGFLLSIVCGYLLPNLLNLDSK
jgi:hypothetical protein